MHSKKSGVRGPIERDEIREKGKDQIQEDLARKQCRNSVAEGSAEDRFILQKMALSRANVGAGMSKRRLA